MRTDLRSRPCLATLGLLLSLSPAPQAQETPILSAMRDEMTRSMADLRMKGEPAPYYIEYEIDDISSMRAIARLGGVVDDVADHSRTLRVQVRVGDYQFDSSRFVTQDRGAAGAVASATVPLDDHYDAIRREIWLATDAAYKRAVSVFAKKKAAFQNRAATDQHAGFLARDARADRRCPFRRRRPSTAGGSIARSSSPPSSRRTRTSTRPRSGSPRPTARATT